LYFSATTGNGPLGEITKESKMRYDRDQENSRRGQYGYNRRNERYHQFGAEEDRSMRDSARDYGRFRNEESSYMDDDYFREQDRNYEGESRSGLADFNFGGRSSIGGERRYDEARYERDPYPTQNRNASRFESDYSFDRRDYPSNRYRSYSGGRSHGQYFGDFSDSHTGRYENRGRYEPEHRSMWESVKDFFGVGPKGYSRSDDRIREDVSDALTRDRAVDASEIEISVMSGIVTLRGSVSDKWMKRRAEDCAEEITGVKEVRNDLEVRRESSTTGMDYLSSSGRTGSLGTGGTLSAGSASSGTNTTSGAKSSDRGSEKSSDKNKRKLS
jgi:hypothetical protein